MRVRPRNMRMHVCIIPGNVYGSYEWMHMSPRTWQDIYELLGGAHVDSSHAHMVCYDGRRNISKYKNDDR